VGGAGWVSDATTIQGNASGHFWQGINISSTSLGGSGAHYAWIGVPVPTGWTGTANLKAGFDLSGSQSGTGTGQHAYSIACSSVNVTTVTSAPNWIFSSSQTWNESVIYTLIQDTATFTGATGVPGCAPGNTLLFKIAPVAFGTAIDVTLLYYFDISLPHTVQ